MVGSSSMMASTKKEFRVGQRVRIRKKNMKPGYHEGEITRKNTDGTYDVEYGECSICFALYDDLFVS